MLYKDFPEFDKLPDVLTFGPDYLDKLEEKSKREKRVQWLERKRGMTKGKTRTKPGWFPVEKRIEVATAFVAGQTNASRLSELTKVPAATIRKWKTQPWWGDLIEKVRYEKDEEFDARFTTVIEKSLDVVTDALIQGDVVDTNVDEDGNVTYIRAPIKAKDAAHISSMVIKDRNLLRGKPTSRTETLSDKEQLAKLAKQFRELGGATKVIEGEVLGKEENSGPAGSYPEVPYSETETQEYQAEETSYEAEDGQGSYEEQAEAAPIVYDQETSKELG